ncbi:MHCK/EF2 kinase, partial [Ephemerocybe angulata]
GGMKRLPVQEELLHIINECNLMYWCSTIMRCAYQFISAKVEEKGEPPFEIPNLRFLSMAKLQKGESISPMITLGYMLEEMIHGDFVKYIHNGHPVPCTEPPLSDEEYKIAEFLCFTQHVQYLQTKGLAFISDYQGSGNLLTDPQILTSDLGVDMFGLGNVKEGFNRFTTEHSCNKYCKWFELDSL